MGPGTATRAPPEIGVLGPLEVAGPDGPVRIGGAKERLVLALLVLRAGEVVSRDALVDALWGDDPPATAVKTLQGHVARVRRALEAVGMAGVLATRDPGYVLSVPADSIDVAGFERHAAAGRGALADGDPTAGDRRSWARRWRCGGATRCLTVAVVGGRQRRRSGSTSCASRPSRIGSTPT